MPRVGVAVPSFAVIVPAYNASATLRETLDAVLDQEYAAWECIVIDDGSADSTAEIVESYCERDTRFRLIRQKNTGTPGAYQTGVNAATAELIVICAADDLLLPQHMRVMHDVIVRNPEYEIYSSNGLYLYDATGERSQVYSSPEWQQEVSLTFEDVAKSCFFSVGVVYRKHIIETIGGYRIGVYVDDYDVWLRAMARGAKHFYTPEVLAVHRVSGFQQSANLTRVFESNIEVYQNLLAHESLSTEHERAIRQSIAENERVLAEHRADLALEAQSRRMEESVERVFGARLKQPVLRIVHKVSWVTRPVRRLLARVRGR